MADGHVPLGSYSGSRVDLMAFRHRDGRPDWALVATSPAPASAAAGGGTTAAGRSAAVLGQVRWTLDDLGLGPVPGLVESLSGGRQLMAEVEGEGHFLIPLHAPDLGPLDAPPLVVPLADVPFQVADHRVGVDWGDWDGDGTLDAVLVNRDRQRQADEWPGGEWVVVHGRVDRAIGEVVAILGRADVFLDLDEAGLPGAPIEGDAVPEIVSPAGETGTYTVREWDGRAFVPDGTLQDPVPPEERAEPADLAGLPNDLWFIRDRRLWRWPAAGGALEEMGSPVGPDGQILSFQVSADGRSVAYVRFPAASDTHHAELLVRRPTGEQWSLGEHSPSSGGYQPDYALSGDGRLLVYLDSAMASAVSLRAVENLSQGSLSEVSFARRSVLGGDPEGLWRLVEVGTDVRGTEVAPCLGQDPDPLIGQRCQGALVAPDGTQWAWADGAGLWIGNFSGRVRSLIRHDSDRRIETSRGLHVPDRWSPDGRYLLVSVRNEIGGGAVLWNVTDQTLAPAPSGALGGFMGRADHAWLSDSSGIAWTWEAGAAVASIATRQLTENMQASGESMSVDERFPASGLHLELAPDRTNSRVLDGPFDVPYNPGTAPVPFSPGGHSTEVVMFGLRFPERRYRSNGVFRAEPADTLSEPILTLPAVNLPEDPRTDWQPGTVAWSLDASAFAFVDEERGFVGLADGSAAWDATAVLAGATDLIWAQRGP